MYLPHWSSIRGNICCWSFVSEDFLSCTLGLENPECLGLLSAVNMDSPPLLLFAQMECYRQGFEGQLQLFF
jgi:hypothetical protein